MAARSSSADAQDVFIECDCPHCVQAEAPHNVHSISKASPRTSRIDIAPHRGSGHILTVATPALAAVTTASLAAPATAAMAANSGSMGPEHSGQVKVAPFPLTHAARHATHNECPHTETGNISPAFANFAFPHNAHSLHPPPPLRRRFAGGTNAGALTAIRFSTSLLTRSIILAPLSAMQLPA